MQRKRPWKRKIFRLKSSYEDADLAVVVKPCGMVVHPAAGNESGTLVNALLYHMTEDLSGIGGVKRPGIVHRAGQGYQRRFSWWPKTTLRIRA